MARGGGGRGRKVVMNSGKWQTVTKSSSPTKANDDSDDEGIATKMTNEDWSRLFEWFAEAQVICVKRGELPLFFFLLAVVLFNHTQSLLIYQQIVHNSILKEVMQTYCPETVDSYEKILAETDEWIKNHR